jgi:hypothetical protein
VIGEMFHQIGAPAAVQKAFWNALAVKKLHLDSGPVISVIAAAGPPPKLDAAI